MGPISISSGQRTGFRDLNNSLLLLPWEATAEKNYAKLLNIQKLLSTVHRMCSSAYSMI